MTLRIAICCRVHLFAEGVRKLLEEDDELLILGMAHNDEEIKNIIQYEPDVVIADSLSCRAALSCLPVTKNKKVLLVCESDEVSSEQIKGLIDDGLGGILANDADAGSLKKAARKLHDGELWFDRQTMHDVLSQKHEKKSDINLTKKEEEILKHICNGLTNKEIARRLFISEQTVKSHCNHLFKKFGVSSRLKLAVNAPQCAIQRNNSQQHH